MSTFQILILILAFVFVIFEIYFNISGRIINNKNHHELLEQEQTANDFNCQIEMLTKRMSEIMSENDRLNKVCREWMSSSEHYRMQYESLLKDYKKLSKKADNEEKINNDETPAD